MGFLRRELALELVANPLLPQHLQPLYCKLVLANLDENFECWPGKKTMRRYDIGVTARMFAVHLRELLFHGFLEDTGTTRPVTKNNQTYHLKVWRVMYPPPSPESLEVSLKAWQGRSRGGTRFTPDEQTRGETDRPPGVKRALSKPSQPIEPHNSQEVEVTNVTPTALTRKEIEEECSHPGCAKAMYCLERGPHHLLED